MDFVTPRGAAYLGAYARGARPFDGIGERTVSVEVTSVVRASDQSFQVKWSETAYARGSVDGTSRWTAILGIRQRPPLNADTLRRNPLGIYVDAIDWSRELEPVPAQAFRPVAPVTAAAEPSPASSTFDREPRPARDSFEELRP